MQQLCSYAHGYKMQSLSNLSKHDLLLYQKKGNSLVYFLPGWHIFPFLSLLHKFLVFLFCQPIAISHRYKQHLLDTAYHQLKMLVALFCWFHSLLLLLFQKANSLESKYASSLEPKDLETFFLPQTHCLISKSLLSLNVTQHFHYGISPPVNYLIKGRFTK